MSHEKAWRDLVINMYFSDDKKQKDLREHTDAEKKYCTSPNYIHRKIGGSDVLISVGANIANFNGYIEVNESAAVLWEKLKTPCSAHELAKLLEEEYGIPHETAVEDVREFIDLLLEHDMVVVQ